VVGRERVDVSLKHGQPSRRVQKYLALAVLVVVATTGLAFAVGQLISNQLNKTVTAGTTARIAWNPEPATPVGLNQPNTFGVDLLDYNGTDPDLIHLNLVVTDNCADLELREGTSPTPLPEIPGTGTCTFESSGKGPQEPQRWTFTVTYLAPGSYSWTVVAHQP
jgi:hypothetical protein